MRNLLLTTIVSLFLLPIFTVSAAGMIDVVFEQDPLFGEMNMKPGDSVSRTVTVTNNDTVGRQVYAGVNSTGVDGGLAGALALEISSPLGTHYSDSLAAFLATSSVYLDVLAAGQSRVYTFDVLFIPSSGNSYQATTAGFDLLFGFGSASDPSDPDGGGGGGGGGVSVSSVNTTTSDPGPTPQVAGAADSAPGFWEGLVEEGRRYLDSIAGRVLGESTSAQEPTPEEEEILNGITIDEEIIPIMAGGEDNCGWWWLFVIIWAVVSAVIYYFKGWGMGLISMHFSQLVFLLLALLGQFLYYVLGVLCSFWPALIVLIGSTILLLVNHLRQENDVI